ncbi:hypothetical protein [Microbacterium oleivorans]|uniref:Uncharacterized protein n=1 Tax=Microbacterium oleivorans TaxID=273677 RepID=A0A7D5ISJ3_9MICO|nr:hypothetical protein [Microbacterium oleivorans]QLD11374.1 hypothetical protein HW566_06050 [Microbacterium oleivorans]
MTEPTEFLAHTADDCAADRVDVTEHEEQDITTLHCVDCGAHAAYKPDGTQLAQPDQGGAMTGVKQGAAYDGIGFTIPTGNEGSNAQREWKNLLKKNGH